MPNNDVIEILLAEYKALWNYYTCQINILSGFRQLYIKIFLVPASILGAAGLVLSKSVTTPTVISADIILRAIALLLFIGFMMGLALFKSYYKELGNLGNYEQAMIDIRRHLRAASNLSGVLTVDIYRTGAPIAQLGDKKERFYQSLLYSLGAIFIVGNSFLISLAAASFLTSMKWPIAIWYAFIGLWIVAFLVFRWWSYRLYEFYTGGGAAELGMGPLRPKESLLPEGVVPVSSSPTAGPGPLRSA